MNSDEVRRQWAERSGAYSPEYYAYHGADKRSEAVRERLERHVDRDARVLELGCSSGRHLAHLAANGFENLAGIELNDEAFAVMADTYPDLAAEGTFYCAAIEDVVTEFADGAFDAVYSVETLQHIHADSTWAFGEIARITGDLLVTVENEGERADTAGDAGGATGVSDTTRAGDAAGGDSASVNYVDDGVPLYYRDWNRVFTGLGFTELDAETGRRDVMRTFRRERSSN